MILPALLTLGVTFINGWTDAPNTMAATVATGAIRPRAALLLAAVCEFFGCFSWCFLFPAVAETILNLADFDGFNSVFALSAAMLTVILWGVVCWYFGIPSSESHALISALTGAALVFGKYSVHAEEWLRILSGILIPCGIGAIFGWILSGLSQRFCAESHVFSALSVTAAALSSFMHGAQDGQKFYGVFVLIFSTFRGKNIPYSVIIILISVTLALGAATSGTRILRSVGSVAALDARRGFSADASSVIAAILTTLFGLPASTTHIKTAAILGSAAEDGINRRALCEMLLTWALTFPGCGALGYIFTSVFLHIV